MNESMPELVTIWFARVCVFIAIFKILFDISKKNELFLRLLFGLALLVSVYTAELISTNSLIPELQLVKPIIGLSLVHSLVVLGFKE